MKNKKEQEEILERLLLLMSYDTKKTLKENILSQNRIPIKESETSERAKDYIKINPPTYSITPDYRLINNSYLIPKWDGSNIEACSQSKNYWKNIWKNSNKPMDKFEIFWNYFSKRLNPNSVCSFTTPDNKKWKFIFKYFVENYKEIKAYQPWFEGYKGESDNVFYNQKDYVNTNVITKDVKPWTTDKIQGVQNNESFGIAGPYLNGELLKDNQLKFEDNKGYELTWRIYNNTDEPLKIDDIKIEGLPITYETNIKYDKNKVVKSYMDYIDVIVYIKPTIEQIPLKETNFNLNEQNKINFPKLEIEKPKGLGYEPPELPGQTFRLEVKTNKGDNSQNINIEESPEKKQENLVRIYKDRALKRKSVYEGKDVPEGFSPFTYDEYLYWKKIENQLIQRYGESTPTGKAITPNVLSNNPELEKTYGYTLGKIRDLGKNEDFPMGIVPEDKKEFFSEKRRIETELKSLEKKYTVQKYPPSGSANDTPFDYFDKESMSSEDKQKFEKLNEDLKILYYRYGYDSRSGFDKFMDSYGIWIQAAIALSSLIATWGASSIATAGVFGRLLAQAGMTAQGLRTVAGVANAVDVWVNGGLAGYYAIKGDGPNAAISLFFAFLPKLHQFYGKIGEYFPGGKINPEVALSLQRKFANVTIRTQDDLNAIFASMSKTEREYVRGMMRIPGNVMSDAFQVAEQRIAQEAAEQGTKLNPLKVPGKTLGEKSIGILKTGGLIYLDFKLMHTIENLYNGMVDVINCYCRKQNGVPCKNEEDGKMLGTSQDFEKYKFDCLMSKEEMAQWQTYLKNMNPSQFDVLVKILNEAQTKFKNEENKNKFFKKIVSGELTEEDLDKASKIIIQKSVQKQIMPYGDVIDMMMKEFEIQTENDEPLEIKVQDTPESEKTNQQTITTNSGPESQKKQSNPTIEN